MHHLLLITGFGVSYSHNELVPLIKEQLLLVGNAGSLRAVPYTTAQGKGQAATEGATYIQSFKSFSLLVKVNPVPRHTDPSQELPLWMSLFIYTNSRRSQECPNAQQKSCNTRSGKGLLPPVFPGSHVAADGAVVSVNFPEGLTAYFWIFFPDFIVSFELSFIPFITNA